GADRDHGIASVVLACRGGRHPRDGPRPHRRLRQTQRTPVPLCDLPSFVEPAASAPRTMSNLLSAAVDFQSDARKIDERRPPWVTRVTLYVLVAVTVVACVWAALARVDRIVVAPGKLVT